MNYDKALACFARALSLGFPRDEERRKSLMGTMLTYLDRLQEITLKSADKSLTLKESTEEMPATNQLNKERRMVIKEMAKLGLQTLARGVKLKRAASDHEKKGELFEAFVLYQECLDCLVAYMDSEKVKANKETSDKIMKLVLEMLEKAESIKKQL